MSEPWLLIAEAAAREALVEGVRPLCDRIAELETANGRLRRALDVAMLRLGAIRDGDAYQPHLHAGGGLLEIKDILTPPADEPPHA